MQFTRLKLQSNCPTPKPITEMKRDGTDNENRQRKRTTANTEAGQD